MESWETIPHFPSTSNLTLQHYLQFELMKPASATIKMIERYFCMLTNGCGNRNCDNENCVTSGKIQPKSPDQATTLAVNLLRRGAELCELSVSRVSRAKSLTSCLTFKTFPSSDTSDNILVDLESSIPVSQYEFLTETSICGMVKTCLRESRFSQLKGAILQVFSNADTLSKSFLKSKRTSRSTRFHANDIDSSGKEKLSELEEDTDNSRPADKGSPFMLNSEETELDFIALRRCYDILFKVPSSVLEDCLLRALKLLAETCEMELKVEMKDEMISPEDVEKYVISFLIIFEMPSSSVCHSVEYIEQVLPLLYKSMTLLPNSTLARICRLWARHCRTSFERIIGQLHEVITSRTRSIRRRGDLHFQDDVKIVSATKVMKVLYYANALAGKLELPLSTEGDGEDLAHVKPDVERNIRQRLDPSLDWLATELKFDLMDYVTPYLPSALFYNELLSDLVQMDADYTNYKSARPRPSSCRSPDAYFSFMSHPFILTPATKTLGLFYDNRIRMLGERRAISLLNARTGGVRPSPYLKLRVRRDHLIEDTLMRLEMISNDTPQDFKKQLMVEFEGEQGMDRGGVSKEFFQLIVEEIFNPDYGMFTTDPDSQLRWFSSASFENDSQYMLIGLMLGLAIYNNIILDVRFPMVVYKKLLGKRGTFGDLEDFNLVLYNSLKCLLEHKEDDMEEVYSLSFRIAYEDPFGSIIHHDLIADGNRVAVSLHNKQKFVRLYVDFLLNKLVAEKFSAFRKGFQLVTNESPLKFLFRPEEIEMLVCGSKNFDLYELQRTTRYDGGYEASTSVVKYFWEFVHSLLPVDQRKLLQFITGSDRVPVGGFGHLQMMIVRNGSDSDRLPTAHTCFNVLLLPEYSTRGKLFDRMTKAINYSTGFGML